MVRKKDDIADLDARYDWIRRVTDEAIAQRSSVAEFHGLEQELVGIRATLLESYAKTRSIRHIRDRGDHREVILRHTLVKLGLIPKKYAISERRMRVVAPSGHISPELDLVFYDDREAVTLRRFEDTLDYIPIEAVHGMIQVKSKLSKAVLADGLEKIRKFKALKAASPLKTEAFGMTISTSAQRRFGILFAYEYDLQWGKVIRQIKAAATEHGPATLPNLIVILDKGHMVPGDKDKYRWQQSDLESTSEVMIHGFPDLSHHSFQAFYSFLMALLKTAATTQPDVERYLRLPLTAGSISYSYSHGATSELAECPRHGPYLKTINARNLEKIVGFAKTAEPINWIKATDIAYGHAGDNQGAYDRQPGKVRIYNPDALPLPDILVGSNQTLTYDSLNVAGMHIWVPYYYDEKEGLIDACPRCR